MDELDFNHTTECYSTTEPAAPLPAGTTTKPRKYRQHKLREIEKRLEALRLKRELEDIFDDL